MEEQTTTEAPVETGVEQTQPVESEQATAATQTTETETQTESPEATEGESSEEDALAKFAKAKGLELDSDNAKKAAKMAMEAEKRMHSATGRATELEKTMSTMSDESAQQVAQATGQDPEVLKRLQRMEVKDSIRDFWETHPDAKQYEKEMAKIAVESGLSGSADAILKAAYAMAVANNQGAVKSQGKREALESLAHKQQAAVPTGSATNAGTLPKEKPFEELSIKEMEAKLGFVHR
jgi:hypothetical protein